MRKKKKIPENSFSSCELTTGKKVIPKEKTARNRVYRHTGDFSWKGIKTEKYKPAVGGWQSILRRVLVGNHGERTRFHVRYFEIEQGGFSTFEKHRHEHVVIPVRGKGRILMGRKVFIAGYLDVFFIKPDSPHQLSNPFSEPFGFLCIVNAKRDRPVPLSK